MYNHRLYIIIFIYPSIYLFDRNVVCPNRVAVRTLERSRSRTDFVLTPAQYSQRVDLLIWKNNARTQGEKAGDFFFYQQRNSRDVGLTKNGDAQQQRLEVWRGFPFFYLIQFLFGSISRRESSKKTGKTRMLDTNFVFLSAFTWQTKLKSLLVCLLVFARDPARWNRVKTVQLFLLLNATSDRFLDRMKQICTQQ